MMSYEDIDFNQKKRSKIQITDFFLAEKFLRSKSHSRKKIRNIKIGIDTTDTKVRCQ